MNWIKCSERLPPISRTVLLFNTEAIPFVGYLDYEDGEFVYYQYGCPSCIPFDEITYWCEISPPGKRPNGGMMVIVFAKDQDGDYKFPFSDKDEAIKASIVLLQYVKLPAQLEIHEVDENEV
jgi:hypothetical protein